MPPIPSEAEASSFFKFTNTLQPVRRVWVQAITSVVSGFGLPSSVATAVVLASRHGKKGVKQNALAEEVGVNPGAMVRILDQAEAAGLIERRDAADDRRSKTVHVVRKGQLLSEEIEVAVKKLRASVLGDLPVKDIETATRVLREFEKRVNASLQEGRASK